MGIDKTMQAYAARLDTFHAVHQLSKRRASAQSGRKKAAGNTVEWPHQQPTPEDLARAGFFYRPAQDSVDNVQCFSCAVKLDGWETSDDPVREHLAHSGSCSWALSIRAGLTAQGSYADSGDADPMSDELVAARRGTFESDDSDVAWPHEGKRGWKCKVGKMVDAGWCWDPAPTVDGEDGDGDGVTCFYCNLSLDGWEPKDDPMEEHKKRSPHCAFFALVEQFGSGKGKKSKSKTKAGSRTSTTSKASRMSTQSVVSVMSDALSLAGSVGEEEGLAKIDDSNLTVTAAQDVPAGTTKSKTNGGKAKASAKGAKGRKRTNTVDSEAGRPELYPDLHLPGGFGEAVEDLPPSTSADLPSEPAPKPKKNVRRSKQLESSVIEIDSVEMPATKKTTRKGKAPSKVGPATPKESDFSEVSAQLQEELEHSLDLSPAEEMDPTQPEPEPVMLTRGVKRTSDGLKKSGDSHTAALLVEFPVPPDHATKTTKAKKGRKPSNQASSVVPDPFPIQVAAERPLDDAPMSEMEAEPTVSKKTKAKPRAKGKKTSSARSSRSSRATVTADFVQTQPEPEDLERDEREIEEELQRIAAQQAEHAVDAEFEGSPSHTKQHAAITKDQLSDERQRGASTSKPLPLSPPPAARFANSNATPSPSNSDKENQPSSIIHPSTKAPQTKPASPVANKPTRIPLAPGTPNRALHPSPNKRLAQSPSKQIRALHSTLPWEPVDLDSVTMLTSPQRTLTPGTLTQRLASAAASGFLASPEKALTVEQWIQLQAEKGEKELRRRCEELVGQFEAEGNRAMEVLGGVVVR